MEMLLYGWVLCVAATTIRDDCRGMLRRFDYECFPTNVPRRYAIACDHLHTVSEYRRLYYRVQTVGAECYIQ